MRAVRFRAASSPSYSDLGGQYWPAFMKFGHGQRACLRSVLRECPVETCNKHDLPRAFRQRYCLGGPDDMATTARDGGQAGIGH
jgi:hypothetical protein